FGSARALFRERCWFRPFEPSTSSTSKLPDDNIANGSIGHTFTPSALDAENFVAAVVRPSRLPALRLGSGHNLGFRCQVSGVRFQVSGSARVVRPPKLLDFSANC